MSHSTAARSGASESGRSASATMSAVGAATRRSMPAMSSRLLRLAAIGSAAGAFSGLFGVGGGTVIVPLLILWFAFEEREATGTSLAAIVLVAALAAGIQGLHGHVHALEGLIVGAPAVAGVVAGTALQQRIPQRAVSGAFAVLMVISAIVLVF